MGWAMWIKMERPRASLHFCLVKGQSVSGKLMCVCVCVSVGRTPGILERLLLTDLMLVLDIGHVADTLSQNVCLHPSEHSERLYL